MRRGGDTRSRAIGQKAIPQVRSRGLAQDLKLQHAGDVPVNADRGLPRHLELDARHEARKSAQPPAGRLTASSPTQERRELAYAECVPATARHLSTGGVPCFDAFRSRCHAWR
jgi:hypothetical protein